MPGFLSKLLRRFTADAPSEAFELEELEFERSEQELRELRRQGRESQWSGRRNRPTELDCSRADYIPLPPSPESWNVYGRYPFLYYNDVFQLDQDYILDEGLWPLERLLDQMDEAGKTLRFTAVHATAPPSEPPFTITGNVGWALVEERELTRSEQPDPAFDIVAVTRWGTWLVDRSRDYGVPQNETCVVRRMDRSGSPIVEKRLGHDARWIRSVPPGSHIAIVDDQGMLYIYDMALNLLVRSDLDEIAGQVGGCYYSYTPGWYGPAYVSSVSAIDTAPHGARYVFTVGDEAWCKDRSGQTVWGIVTPHVPDWKRVVRRAGSFATSGGVEKALRLFGLSLPVSPTDIKHKYRHLAFAHRPERNPGDSAATEKMKAVNEAFEHLTGVDPTTLELGESDKTFFARNEPDQLVEVAGEATMPGDARKDEISAASFAAADGGVYISTHSGKAMHLSREGSPLAVYDVGTEPREIADTGRYTYFLTCTRLYVIEGRDKLAAFHEIFRHGKLIVSKGGIGLLGSNGLQWFSADGTMLGELTTRDSIRAIYAAEGGAIVQTQQHQVRVHGLDI